MKIRTQLGLSLSGMLALSFFVAVVAVALVLKQMVLKQIEQDQKSQVSKLAAVSQQAMLLKDELFLLNYVRLLKTSPGVNYAYFVNPEGKIIVHTDPTFVYQPYSKWMESGSASQAIEWESQVVLKGQEGGTARIGFSKEFTQAAVYRTWREILSPIAEIAVSGVIVSLLLGMVMAFFMSRSIQRLVKAAQQIGRGDLSSKIPVESSSSELSELAKQFNYMVQQLNKLDELKADFISVVSHDLRSPLAGIVAYVDYLRSGEIGKLEGKQAQAIETIKIQCLRLSNMVNNILDMAKIQSGKIEFLREPFEIGKAIGDVVNLFELNAKEKGLSLKTDVPAGIPPALGDSDKVQQVMINLVSNALKFTKSGGVITLGARDSVKAGMIEVFVKDTGTGIPPEELPRMFERFHQVNLEQQRAMNLHGTGLGLAISKGFVEALGGKIWVESQLGQGTAFYFTLPKASADTRKPVIISVKTKEIV